MAYSLPTLLLGVVLGCAVFTVLLVLRERGHRRRINVLFDRLSELEELWTHSSNAPDSDEISPFPFPSQTVDVVRARPLRGRLSTAISSLWKKHDGELPSTERLDVRSIQLLCEHLSYPMTPLQLANELNASLRTLQRSLAKSLRCSPSELIIAVKMREAKNRLSSGKWQVQEVARSVGFDDASHFSRRFRAYYGVPPSQVKEAAA